MVKTKAREINNELQEMVSKLQVDAMGVARLDDFKGSRLEETALRLLPSVKSIVVVGMQIYSEVLELVPPEKKVDGANMGDLLESHMDFLSTRLNEAVYSVARSAHKAGFEALPLPVRGLPMNQKRLVPIFSYKHAAQAAGVGNFGRHSLIITPEFGPRVRLACCLTEAALMPKPTTKHNCGKCYICIEHCPSSALSRPQGDEPYSINKFACSIFRAGNSCSECLRVCPAGK